MIVPNKVTRFNESILGKIPFILSELKKQETTIEQLYMSTQDYFDEVDEFILSLDVLYILEAIDVDLNKGVIKYAERD
ncbi:hypothetical protein RGU12_08045 [Fredinandcohnia sp. QZ13]|uniref:ABC-three component system middle component 7 n=1 Tax=Fredinandcohnia sp. QZ13 TaxID=3073144 RepID=UPI0028533E90|nr:ABC-three component system middle component 7 [Fredinandcohnia sp. QZ13]MDR4887512.1 hypothetical protein [Fredinandcohnia sp. QZ13]